MSGANMLSSPVPIYLGCAGLIVGGLGLGAQHLLGGGNSVSAIDTSEQPLFARSVEEASLPTSAWPSQTWPSQNRNVAHFEPMVELLTTPARPAQPENPPAATRDNPNQNAQRAQEEPRAASREVVRDVPQQQTTQPRRSRNQQSRGDARGRNDAAPPVEQADPRDGSAQEQPRAQERQRASTESEKREQGSRRSSRRYQEREDTEPVDERSSPDRRRVEQDDRRQREREPRVVIREEPEQRFGRGPEYREGPGFNPLGIFGAFERY
jgi:ribonuclease E